MAQAPAAAKGKSNGGQLLDLLKSPDMQFAVAIIGVIMTLIVPLPPIILDMALCISISMGFLILLISIYIKEPLEFSTFPTLLLLTTLFRLGLNVATTRSILLEAQNGHISKIVSAFGNFVVGGNYLVGAVIFAILVIINFMVITKGAGRVAEVGARFTLDAMPGKQMAIDAELNAGLIDRDEAKRRRSKVEREADFYGAMDGASKFVRGDAIAGLIITVVNVIMGLLLGVISYGMSFKDAAKLYTLMTIGDGLVSQIPALIISTAAGIVVTRAGGTGQLSDSLNEQVLNHPKAIWICAGLLIMFSLMPGLPFAPFAMLATGLIFLGRYAQRFNAAKAKKVVKEADDAKKQATPDTIESLLRVDVLALEVGVGLIPLVDSHQDGEVLERIVSARKQFAQDMGIIVPMVMVRDNIQLKPGEYQLLLRGNCIGRGNLMVDYYLAMDPGDIPDPIRGIPTKEPAYGLDALWIKASQKEDATFRGYTVVNSATVIVTHLTKLIEENAHDLIGRQEVQHLVDGIKQEYPKVIEEVIGSDRMSLGEVVKVLQNLLEEKVSIRDLTTVFETLADYCRSVKSPEGLTRYVRKALGRGIIKKYLTPDDKLMVVTFDRAVEDLLVAGLQHREDGTTSLQLEPELAHKILHNIADALQSFQTVGTNPIILCGSLLRWELKQLIKRFIPGVTILAFDELPPGTKSQSIAVVSL